MTGLCCFALRCESLRVHRASVRVGGGGWGCARRRRAPAASPPPAIARAAVQAECGRQLARAQNGSGGRERGERAAGRGGAGRTAASARRRCRERAPASPRASGTACAERRRWGEALAHKGARTDGRGKAVGGPVGGGEHGETVARRVRGRLRAKHRGRGQPEHWAAAHLACVTWGGVYSWRLGAFRCLPKVSLIAQQ